MTPNPSATMHIIFFLQVSHLSFSFTLVSGIMDSISPVYLHQLEQHSVLCKKQHKSSLKRLECNRILKQVVRQIYMQGSFIYLYQFSEQIEYAA